MKVQIEILAECNRASIGRIKEFVKDALEHWGGQFHPDDPLFSSLEIETLKIKEIPGANRRTRS